MSGPSPEFMRDVENTQLDLHRAVEEAMKDLDGPMRSLFKKQFQRSIDCCDNKSLSREGFYKCMEETQAPLMAVQRTLDHEINEMQNRFVRCAQTCQDDAQESLRGGSAADEARVLQCFKGCSQKHIDQLPAMMARIKAMF